MKSVDLFRVTLASAVWTMTNSDVDQFYDAGSGDERYVPTPMKRSGIEQKNELSKASLEIDIPLEHPLALTLLTSVTEQVMSLTVFTVRDAGTFVAWKGRLSGLKPGDTQLTLVFESIFTSLRRPGLRARFQRSCRHALYGRGCTLAPASFATAGTVAAIAGNVVTCAAAAAEADQFYQGGMLQASDGTYSYIIDHTGSSLTLQRVSFSLANDFAVNGVATAVNIYPGCDHSRDTCDTKFSNLLNYGGFDWIPSKNPMGGSSIV